MINGRRTTDATSLIGTVRAIDPGSKAKVEIIRDGKSITKEIIIGKRDEAALAEQPSDAQWRGITVKPVTEEIQKAMRLRSSECVIIDEVMPHTPCAEAGLRKGDIIYKLNQYRIRSLADFSEAIKKIEGRTLVITNRGAVIIRED